MKCQLACVFNASYLCINSSARFSPKSITPASIASLSRSFEAYLVTPIRSNSSLERFTFCKAFSIFVSMTCKFSCTDIDIRLSYTFHLLIAYHNFPLILAYFVYTNIIYVRKLGIRYGFYSECLSCTYTARKTKSFLDCDRKLVIRYVFYSECLSFTYTARKTKSFLDCDRKLGIRYGFYSECLSCTYTARKTKGFLDCDRKLGIRYGFYNECPSYTYTARMEASFLIL